MKVLYRAGDENIALVYIAKTDSGKYVEFVESTQPPIPRYEKWVLIVSTLFGCPIGCSICDAGTYFDGKLSKKEIFSQIDFLIKNRFPDSEVKVGKFKIQFARMGEPALNPSVAEVLKDFGNYYDAPGFIPSISTVAPLGCDEFFENIADIKKNLYSGGRFQMQFSLHSTSEKYRDDSIPVKKWGFKKIAEYGEIFYNKDDRKITLNFALSENTPFDPEVIGDFFDPEIFVLKLTPVNPTRRAVERRLNWKLDVGRKTELGKKINRLNDMGFEVIESVGELEENRIGSNCGQHLLEFLDRKKDHITVPYDYNIEDLE